MGKQTFFTNHKILQIEKVETYKYVKTNSKMRRS